MKKIIFLFAAVMAMAFSASAQLEYRQTPFVGGLPVGTTNSFVVDTRNTSGLALQVAFSGSGANTTTALIGVTNSANATNGQSISVIVAGVTNLYIWTNNPVLTITNLSGLATNLVIGITNIANATNGQTLAIILNNRTNTFTFATPAIFRTDVPTNATVAGLATNLSVAIARTLYPRTVTVADTVITLSSLSTDYQIGASETNNILTNNLIGFYTVTNVVTTNSLQILQTNAIGATATNLFNKLSNDFSGTLTVTMPTTTQVQIVTILNPGLTVTQSGTWATNLITTNAINGFLNFQASNSLDKVTWVRQTARDFTVSFNGTTAVAYSTNYTDLFAAGWWAWSVGNSVTNYANAGGIQILSAVKQGL